MYPHERSLVNQLADKPFAIIGVNSDSNLKEIRKIVKKKNLTWRSFQNSQEDGDISDTWSVRAWPTFYILDKDGRIRHKDISGGDRIDAAIEELLGEMGHEIKITHKDHDQDDHDHDAEDESDEGSDEGSDEKQE